MDTQAITINEYHNDGSFINLYYNESIGEWCAYGFRHTDYGYSASQTDTIPCKVSPKKCKCHV